VPRRSSGWLAWLLWVSVVLGLAVDDTLDSQRQAKAEQ
jgi:hypothetical protein